MAYFYSYRTISSGSVSVPSNFNVFAGKFPCFINNKCYLIKDPSLYLFIDPYARYVDQSILNDSRLSTNGLNYDLNSQSDTGTIPGNATDAQVNWQKQADPADATLSCIRTIISFNDADTAGTGTKRTELAWFADNHGFSLGSTYWITTRVRFASNIFSSLSTNQCVFMQVHDNNTSTDSLNPPFSGIVTGGGSGIAKLIFAINGQGSNPAVKASATSTQLGTFNYAADTWYTIVVKYKPHYDVTGSPFTSVWVNGSLIGSSSAINDYNSGQASTAANRSYMKHGLYHFDQATWSAGNNHTMYSKGLSVYMDDSIITELFLRTSIEAL